jgi:hypothetical protein
MALSFKEKTAQQKIINEQKAILSGNPTPAQKADAQKKLNDAMTALGISIPSKYGGFENGGYYAGDVIEKGVAYKIILAPKETERMMDPKQDLPYTVQYGSNHMTSSQLDYGSKVPPMQAFMNAARKQTVITKADTTKTAITNTLNTAKAAAAAAPAQAMPSMTDPISTGAELTANMQNRTIWPSCVQDFPAAASIKSQLNDKYYNGFNDWHLPSLWEMNVVYYNLKPTTSESHLSAAWSTIDTGTVRKQIVATDTPVFPKQCKVSYFQAGVETSAEDLKAHKPANQALNTEINYWTATLTNRLNTAYSKSFENGEEHTTDIITTALLVRAIRKIPA